VLVVSHDRDFLDRVATSVLMAEGAGKFVEYAGGYSDMVAQRGQGVEARAIDKPKAEKSAAPKERRRADGPATKLSFKDKHALETLPARMTALEKEIAALHRTLEAPDFYTRDQKGFAAASAKLEAAQAELASSEERWLELEMLREELAKS
jgi:ATP-binding cassette subfamily F protein uup